MSTVVLKGVSVSPGYGNLQEKKKIGEIGRFVEQTVGLWISTHASACLIRSTFLNRAMLKEGVAMSV